MAAMCCLISTLSLIHIFGQSSKVSYLQMITAVCAVVNGGKLMQPHVVQSIRDTERNTVQQVEPTVKAQDVYKRQPSAPR